MRADNSQTIGALASEAGVSRSWIYADADLREQLRSMTTRPAPSTSPARSATSTPSSDASLRRRLELANARIRDLTRQNETLRAQLEAAHGALRARPREPELERS